MDFVTGLPTTPKGNDSIWVIVDCLTKLAHFLPVKNAFRPPRYAKKHIAEIVRLHGIPKTIVSNRGSQFTTHFWEHLHKGLCTSLIRSIAYHSQTDGQTERVNAILEDMFRAYVLSSRGSWESWLLLAEFAYNNSYQESIKIAPFEALYGRKCRTPLNWVEPRERRFYGIDFVDEAEKKVCIIQQNMRAA
jgi:transposase InsO family protein